MKRSGTGILLLVFLISISLAGCGNLLGGLVPKIKPTVTLSSAVSNGQIDAGQTVTVQAFTSDDNGAGVTWALATGNPGTLANVSTTQVIYDSPSTLTSSAAITITATSKSDSTVTATLSLTVQQDPAISGTLPTGTVGAAYTGSLTVTGGVGPFFWNVIGLPNGITTTPSASTSTLNFTGTPSTQGAYSLTVTVNDSAVPSVSTIPANLTLNINAAAAVGANILFGHYAFLLQGFDSAGKAATMVGSFTADGNGGISSGSMDVNDNFAIGQNKTGLAGNYTVDSNLHGMLGFSTSVSQITRPLSFAYTLSADGTHGSIISFDANGFRMSGEMKRQDNTAFRAMSSPASYAFGLDSKTTPRKSVAGQFLIDSNSQVTGVLDEAEAGSGYQGNLALTGSLDVAPDLNGRGTIILAANQFNRTFLYYAVSADELYLMETDTAEDSDSILAGRAKRQKLPFAPATVNATSVFGLTGFDMSLGASGSLSAIGRLQISNEAGARMSFDQNAATGALIQTANLGGTVTFDHSTGRGVLSVANGFSRGLFDQSVFYLYDSGAGFLVEATPDAANRAMLGVFSPQSVGSNFAAPSGKLIGVFGGSSNDAAAAMSLNVHDGRADGVADVRSTLLLSQPDQAGRLFQSGTFSAPDSSGRGVATLPGEPFGLTNEATFVYYLLGPDQFILLPTVPAKPSAIGFFGPQ
jgi:hypothetical protein